MKHLLLLSALLALPAAAADRGRELFAACTACHGADGGGDRGQAAPNLTGQTADYLLRQLTAFADGTRKGGNAEVMQAVAGGLSQADREAVTAAIAALPRQGHKASEAGPELAPGRNFYNAICSACHGTAGKGTPSLNAPRLGGQNPDYLKTQYAAFKSGERGGDQAAVPARQMRAITRTVPDAATEAAVLAYLATLGD